MSKPHQETSKIILEKGKPIVLIEGDRLTRVVNINIDYKPNSIGSCVVTATFHARIEK